MLAPKIVGKWDANHVWLQWTPAPENAYALRLRYLRVGAKDWTKWVETHTPWPLRETYLKIPTHSQGARVQAQVAVWIQPIDDPLAEQIIDWETARAAEFQHCEAEFEFVAERKVTFAAGDTFTTMVDADVASFILGEELEVFPGTPARVKMRAAQATGVCQLDYPGHFLLRPRPGVQVLNVAPSENDLKELEGDFVTIEGARLRGPMSIAFGRVNQPRT